MAHQADRSRKPSALQPAPLDPAHARPPKGPLAHMLNNSPKVIALRALADSLNGSAEQAHAEWQAPPPNLTGLPDGLKTGMEALSGLSLDDVRVHRNSDRPADLQAHAFAQGTDIHLAPGQEQHLPHEAWHVVQQMQGRVRPTMQLKDGVGINDDRGLEREADVMGARALQQPAVDRPGRAGQPQRSAGNALQPKADMAQRGRQKRSLKRVRDDLVAARENGGNRLATGEEIGEHDRAQNSGQHHGIRKVFLNQLIGDIDQTLAQLTDRNLTDSDALGAETKAGRGEGVVAVQLRRIDAAGTVPSSVRKTITGGSIVQAYADLAAVKNDKHLATAAFTDQERLDIANWCEAHNDTNSVRSAYLNDLQFSYQVTENNIVYDFDFDWTLAMHVDLAGASHGGVPTPHLQLVPYLNGVGTKTQSPVAISKAGVAQPAPVPLLFKQAANAIALSFAQAKQCMDDDHLDSVKAQTYAMVRTFSEDWARAFADKDSGAKELRANEEVDFSDLFE